MKPTGKSIKTTICGVIAAIFGTLSYSLPEYKDIFQALAGLAVAVGLLLSKDGNVTGGNVSNGLKTLLMIFILSFPTGKAGAQTYSDGWSNVWVVAPAVENGILVSHNGTVSASPKYFATDSSFIAISLDTANGAGKSDTSRVGVVKSQGKNSAVLQHTDSTGNYYVLSKHGGASMSFIEKDSTTPKFSVSVTSEGVSIDNEGNAAKLTAVYTGSYTSDTANATKFVVNTISTVNYTVTDSIIEFYGYVSGVSSDSLLENYVDLDLPTDFDNTINGLQGVCSVYSAAQTVKGNGICIGSADKVRVIFYPSRKAALTVYFRFSYRYL